MDIPKKDKLNVPIEQVYFYDDINNVPETYDDLVERDPNKNNRFWFKVPPMWNTSDQKERVIGVRSFWINKRYRKIFFTMEINKIDNTTQKSTNLIIKIKSWIYFNKDFRELWKDIKDYLQKAIDRNIDQWKANNQPIISVSDFQMDWSVVYPNTNIKAYTYNDRGEYVEIDEPNVNDKSYPQFCNILYVTNEDTNFNIGFKLREFNHDAIACLNITDEQKEFFANTWLATMYFTDMWDRYDVLVSSSIAYNTYRNFLGFSGHRYTPIKYYKINDDSRFWIDLYDSHIHEIPVNLPRDNKEGLVFEIVVLNNAKELY